MSFVALSFFFERKETGKGEREKGEKTESKERRNKDKKIAK